MTYIVSDGALNSTHSLTHSRSRLNFNRRANTISGLDGRAYTMTPSVTLHLTHQ